jgi:trimethylamine--corrinoid protein Co-methyltransferase
MPSPYELLDEQALLHIESQANSILSEIGVVLQNDPNSLSALKQIGAEIDGDRVRIDFSTLKELVAQAPVTIKWQGPTDQKSVTIGGPKPIFAPSWGTPNILNKNNHKSLGTLEDYKTLVRMCDQSDILDSTGFLLCIAHEGDKLAPYTDLAKAHIELSNKPMMGTVLSAEALRKVATEVGVFAGHDNASKLMHMINLTPPLTYQTNPLECLKASAELGQITVVSSYMMMGATSSVNIAGSLAQGLAEIMVGLALTQIYKPGAPIVGGLFATPFSMRSMLPNFGTPESHLVQLASCQLIRRLGIPCRGDGMITSSSINDAQAGAEGAWALSASLNAGADLILHSAGWLEKGRTTGHEKFFSDVALIKESYNQRIHLNAS